eukprot:CAMPEP_0183422334 /NCGR_PEP_ID=MMETSP0370-20130417/27736_1 /TAXON_ID=268820 /ORGANISM="Peridinium aciculiferum, Strain PAER-2" /LENGTH=47 /DNA_ID= /DNA_START= /DNA_END= /DNA_ORIENTATION=
MALEVLPVAVGRECIFEELELLEVIVRTERCRHQRVEELIVVAVGSN